MSACTHALTRRSHAPKDRRKLIQSHFLSNVFVRQLRAFLILLGISLIVNSCNNYTTLPKGSQPGWVDDHRMLEAAEHPENWLLHGGTFNGEYYSSLNQINQSTVANLRPAWSVDFDTVRGQESEPLVVDGVMYVTSAWSKVYALDAATGRQLWSFDPMVSGQQAAKACCDVVNRGAAVYHGKVFVGTLDGRLIALNASTGKPVWTTQTTDLHGSLTITGAPRVIRNKVIIGNGGADLGARGYVSAYNTETGEQVWRFYLVPGKAGVKDRAISDEVMERMMRPSWFGRYADYGGGGTAWNAISYDPELDRLYVGTGNGSPWNPRERSADKGDNLFLCSIVALDPDTGRYIWHYQQNPREAWDYNSAMPMVLADLNVDGRQHKVILHAPKNGLFYVIDRQTGKPLSAKPFVPVTWTTGLAQDGRPVEVPAARYRDRPFLVRPGAAGAHNWHPMAFSSQTGLVYLNATENGLWYSMQKRFSPKPFTVNTGVDLKSGGPSSGALIAWDPVKQKEVWRVPRSGGGVLATGGGLIIQGSGSATGELSAFRATDGKKLWSYPTPNGIIAGAITYSVKRVQYIAVAAGIRGGGSGGGSQAWIPQPGRLIAFSLNGSAKLPAGPEMAPPPVQSNETFAATAIELGGRSYQEYCSRCHGNDAQSSNVIPDLRRSAISLDATAWKQVVYDGALTERGMIGWSKLMSKQSVENIRSFVVQKARELKGSAREDKETRNGSNLLQQ